MHHFFTFFFFLIPKPVCNACMFCFFCASVRKSLYWISLSTLFCGTENSSPPVGPSLWLRLSPFIAFSIPPETAPVNAESPTVFKI